MKGALSDGPETVAVEPLSGLRKRLGYKVPEPMRARVGVGSLVRVPILRRAELAIVRELQAPGDFPISKLKHILEAPGDFPALTPDLLALADWMRSYYAVSAEAVYETMLPAPVRQGMRIKEVAAIRVARKLSDSELEKLRKKAPKQAMVYTFLATQPPGLAIPKSKLAARLGAPLSSCDALIEKGLAEAASKRIDRDAYQDDLAGAEAVAGAAFELNAEQRAAADDICKSVDKGRYAAHLLHGVTGSGKTEVYLAAIKRALELGGGAIFLVPEVALTPQTAGRLRSRLEESIGARAAVWHSMLSAGERLDAWRALALGEARVVVGARSAVFAPIRNLKLIVVDEEHEPAYKQDETPRYHGRDTAVCRASLCGATCLLGSATPSLESVRNAKGGKYRLNRLTRRIDDRELPLMHVVDMKREIVSRKGPTLFSGMLIDKLKDRFERREQSILFINRRGFSSAMTCPSCGETVECEHCSVALSYHRAEDILRCHICGFERSAPRACPKCGSQDARWRLFGTQRVEDAVAKFLPKARIVRIDADSMKKKNLFRTILGEFRKGKIDVLVGTQMIAKGLDFPNVTLVGLIDADISLHQADFRAAERTFQLLVQVSGRAGRGDRAGEVVVQTFSPHHSCVQCARRHDFDGFIDEELAARRESGYPPYRRLILHMFRCPNEDKAAFYAERWARFAEERLKDENVEMRGPAPAPIFKIKNNYRMQLWYFTDSPTRLAPKIDALRAEFPMDKDVIDVIDVDPASLG